MSKSSRFIASLLIIGLILIATWHYKNAIPTLLIEAEIVNSRIIKVVSIERKQSGNFARIRYQSKNYLLRILNDADFQEFKEGDILLVNARLRPLPIWKNPNSFYYGRYLKFQGYSGLIRIDRLEYLRSEKTLLVLLRAFRNRQAEIIDEWPWTKSTKGIFKALFLGIKSDLSSDSKLAFQKAGILHLLAVSGLHLGIVYVVLVFFTRYLRIVRYGRLLEFIILLGGLWSFAFFTGASPSVLRAATMFSFLGISKVIRRINSGFRPLIASAILLFWQNPLIIQQPGFHLSYAAVIGILYLVPKLNAWHHFSNRKLYAVQQILYVSIAAQFFTLPVSLYYFGSFPLYFLVSNLLILPLMPIIMYGGFAVLLLSNIGFHPPWIDLFAYSIKFIESVSNNIAEFPSALIDFKLGLHSALILIGFQVFLILKPRLQTTQFLKSAILLWLLSGLLSITINCTQYPSLVVLPGPNLNAYLDLGSTKLQLVDELNDRKVNSYLVMRKTGSNYLGLTCKLQAKNRIVLITYEVPDKQYLNGIDLLIYTGTSSSQEATCIKLCYEAEIEFYSTLKGWIRIP